MFSKKTLPMYHLTLSGSKKRNLVQQLYMFIMLQYLIGRNVEKCHFIISFVDIESYTLNLFIHNNDCMACEGISIFTTAKL